MKYVLLALLFLVTSRSIAQNCSAASTGLIPINDLATGQKVKELRGISGDFYTLHRDNLHNGLYLIRIIQENKLIASDKLLVTD